MRRAHVSERTRKRMRSVVQSRLKRALEGPTRGVGAGALVVAQSGGAHRRGARTGEEAGSDGDEEAELHLDAPSPPPAADRALLALPPAASSPSPPPPSFAPAPHEGGAWLAPQLWPPPDTDEAPAPEVQPSALAHPRPADGETGARPRCVSPAGMGTHARRVHVGAVECALHLRFGQAATGGGIGGRRRCAERAAAGAGGGARGGGRCPQHGGAAGVCRSLRVLAEVHVGAVMQKLEMSRLKHALQEALQVLDGHASVCPTRA